MKRRSLRRKLILSAVILLGLLSGCGQQSQVVAEEVSLVNEDGVEIAATLFKAEAGEIAVVMAPGGQVPNRYQDALYPFARELAERGFTAVTFDFRGSGRTAASAARESKARLDLVAALAFLRDQGFARIACFGVGRGGLTCAELGDEVDWAGMVLVSTPTTGITEHLVEILPQDLASPAYPKLIIVAEEDRARYLPFNEMSQTLYDYAAEPKELRVFSGSYHGVELLQSDEHGEAIHDLLLAFFEGL